VCGLVLAFHYRMPVWYSMYSTGGFLFLDGLNKAHGFSVLRSGRRFLTGWTIFLCAALTIDLPLKAHGFISYPALSGFSYVVHTLFIGYPFGAYFALEFIVMVQTIFYSSRFGILLVLISTLAFCFITEFPNVYAREWVYRATPRSFLGVPLIVYVSYILIIGLLLLKPLFKSTTPQGK
jgi:hypothetical protein